MLNSLGDPGDRTRYVAALAAHFEANLDALSHESRQTLARNPLRVLDSKREQDAALVAAAPKIADFWSDAAATDFAAVTDGLRALGVPFTVNSRLVRGLDYYRKTTFEFVGEALDARPERRRRRRSLRRPRRGSRGPATPGIGFALGVDRTLMECDAEGVFAAPVRGVDAFVVDVTAGAKRSPSRRRCGRRDSRRIAPTSSAA